MEAFTVHTGITAPLLRLNIDTDAIIPSREMKNVSKRGLAAGLFAGWRYFDTASRTINPEFILNKTAFKQSSILLGGDNFGCGSSREHAVWALAEYGFRAIICPSFGSIFYQNCIRNGIVPVVLPMNQINMIAEFIEQGPQTHKITVDLLNQQITSNGETDGGDLFYSFDINASHKNMLINGLDVIDTTLKYENKIKEFEVEHLNNQPWIQPKLIS